MEGIEGIMPEGLFPYLTSGETRVAFNNVGRVLRRTGGVFVAVDVTTKAQMKKYIDVSPGMNRIIKAVMGSTGRDLYNNSFENEEQMIGAFRSAGFEPEPRQLMSVQGELTSPGVLGISPDSYVPLLEGDVIWELKRAKA